uniref:Uncharacterized protein n=1 Tax=Anguilla anguilla TaxID=7936 RepID=A0A0E9Q651_ANGAN
MSSHPSRSCEKYHKSESYGRVSTVS